MKAFKRGLIGSLAALGVIALTGGVAADPPKEDQPATSGTSQTGDAPEHAPGDTSQAQGTGPAGTDDPADDTSPPAGDAAHDPRPDAANLPDPVVPPETDATTWSEGNTGDRAVTTTTPVMEETRGSFLSDIGFALAAGAGVDGFTDDTARGATNDGGGWDVRAIIGTKLPVAAEIAYIGSAQTIDALGVDKDALLVGNGVQADVRINVLGDRALQPYIFGGAAWRRYEVTNTDTNTSDIAESDDVLELPVGAGLAFRYSGLMIDARGEYRAATDNDLMPSVNEGGEDADAALHRYGVKLNVGYEF